MGKIEELMKALVAEVDASRAQVTADKTRLDAINSAHDDTKKLLDQNQKDLVSARAQVANAVTEANTIKSEAQKIAAEIRGAADDYVARTTAQADAKAKAIVDAAQKESVKITSEAAKARQQLGDDVLRLRSEHSELSANIGRLREQAKQFAGG